MKDIQLYIDGTTLTPEDVNKLDFRDLTKTHASPALMMFAQRLGESAFMQWGIPPSLTMDTLLVAIHILAEKNIVLVSTDCVLNHDETPYGETPVDYDIDSVRKLLDFDRDTE